MKMIRQAWKGLGHEGEIGYDVHPEGEIEKDAGVNIRNGNKEVSGHRWLHRGIDGRGDALGWRRSFLGIGSAHRGVGSDRRSNASQALRERAKEWANERGIRPAQCLGRGM